MIPKHREPTGPGEVLEEEFLRPLGITQTEFAGKLGRHVQQINLIVNGRRAVTARMALELARALGTTPEFWLNLQNQVDLWRAEREIVSAS